MLARKVIETVETCCAVGFATTFFALPFALVVSSPFWIGA